MRITPQLFPDIITAVILTIDAHADELTELDQIIGDGDHVINLQRGLQALQTLATEISSLDWSTAWQKIAMSLMSSVGGASGSLYATLFLSLAKNAGNQSPDTTEFAELFKQAIDAVKQRGKSDLGDKTMLDVLIPVAKTLSDNNQHHSFIDLLNQINLTATEGAEATRNMQASKGRSSFLGERSIGHIDAGAKSAQLMITAITSVLATNA